MNRYIFVAETDKEARASAERAWPIFHDNFWKLWRRHGGEPKNFRVPDIAVMMQNGFAIIGSTDTVRTELVRQVSESGVNYLSGTFAFGDLTLDEVSNSVRLFSKSVMPAVRTAYDAVRHKHEAAA